MTPVYQTRFGGPDSPPSEQGDCLRASVATLLDLELSEVPDLDPSDWYPQLTRWLRERGLGWFYVEVPHEKAKECRPTVYVMPGTYYIAGGLTSRGTGHAVVYREDRLAHDPIRGRAGLAVVDSYLFIFGARA
jgi:hypothetical protein